VSTEAVRTLGQQLAQMDQLLHDIQAELVPDREARPALVTAAIPDPPAPVPPPPPPPLPEPPARPPIPEPAPPPPPPPDRALDNQIRALAELSERLVASMRELLDGYERVLVPAARLRAAPAPSVPVVAGPFASIEALREFEVALSHLRGVHEVTLRGYEGRDHAIIDVRLA
jgi:hypothetical protein